AVLAGTVVDEQGTPVPGIRIALSGGNGDRARFRGESSLPPAADWYVDHRGATSDARGRFWFGALAAGTYRVHARIEGRPDGPTKEVTLREGEMHDGFELEYPRGESIRGSVTDAGGRGVRGVYVGAQLTRRRDGVPASGWSQA